MLKICVVILVFIKLVSSGSDSRDFNSYFSWKNSLDGGSMASLESSVVSQFSAFGSMRSKYYIEGSFKLRPRKKLSSMRSLRKNLKPSQSVHKIKLPKDKQKGHYKLLKSSMSLHALRKPKRALSSVSVRQ
jgi:hypothetical protein